MARLAYVAVVFVLFAELGWAQEARPAIVVHGLSAGRRMSTLGGDLAEVKILPRADWQEMKESFTRSPLPAAFVRVQLEDDVLPLLWCDRLRNQGVIVATFCDSDSPVIPARTSMRAWKEAHSLLKQICPQHAAELDRRLATELLRESHLQMTVPLARN